MTPQKKYGASLAALISALALLPVAYSATFTFNGTSTGTAPGSTWSSATGWDLAPVSATDTSLVFGNGAALAAATVHTSQDVLNPFQLNSLTFSYAGPATGTPSAQINTNGLRFLSNGATTPTITLSATGGARPQLIFASTVTFGNNTTIGGTSDALFTSTIANVSNAVVTKSGTGVVRIQSTNAAYTGNFTVSGGTLQVGNNGSTGDAGSGTVTLATGNYIVRRNGGTLALNNTITGTGNVTFQTNGGFVGTINRANTYVGTTGLSPTGTNASGSIQLGVNNGLSTSSVLSITNSGTSVQTFNLNGFNQTLGGLSAGSGTASATNTKVTLGAGTLTLNDGGNRTFSGEISGTGNVVKQGAGIWTLGSANTYTGTTTISGGTVVLGAAGSINPTSELTLAAGATLDVSAIPSYTLSASTGLSASGAATPAVLKGGTTVDLGAQPITLLYDGTNPALTISEGALTLNGNPFTVDTAAPLAPGGYTLIQQSTGAITHGGSFTVQGTALSGSTATLDFATLGEVKMNVVAALVSEANSSLAASTATLAADNVATSTLTITLKDAGDTALAGVGVNWAVSGSGNTVSPSDFGTTDGSGVVTFTVKSVKAETKTVTVTVGALTFTTELVFTVPATGFTLAWDPLFTTTTSDGSGSWNLTTANWAAGGANGIWPNNGNDSAVFGNGGALAANATLTLGAPITVGNLTFTNTSANTNQYTIFGTGLNVLTLAGTPIINVAANARFTAPIAGAGFTKQGEGVVRFESDNPSYTGDIAVNAGTLQIGNNSAAGDLGTGTINLSGAALFVVRKQGPLVLNNTLTGSTSGSVGFQLNNSAVVTVAKANTYTAGTGTYLQPTGANTVGTLALGIADALPTNTAFRINANGTTSLQTLDLAGFNQTMASLGGTGTATTAVITSSAGTPTLTVSGTTTTTFAGLVSGSLSLTKAGSGSQTFSGNATYSGNTTVTEGTLSLSNANANNDASTVTIASTGATLELNFVGSDTVGTLFIGGAQQAAGVYEAVGNAGSGTEIAQISGAGTLTVLTNMVGDSTPPAAPTIGLLAASDTGSSSSDLITKLTTPTLRVSLNGTGPTAPLAGDVVKLFNGVTQVASAALSAGDITATFVDLTTGALAPGSLSFTATVTDAASNVSAASTALVVNLDTTAPVITVTSPSSNSAAWGASYTDAGATASDNFAPFTATVDTTNPVSTATPGLYTVTYNATDVAGNTATPATRAVTVAIANATTVGADGFSPLMKYAFGATSPTDTVQAPALNSTASTLALTAVVRTNDANVVVSGEAVDSLTGTWGTGGTVTMTIAGDQTNLPANCQRRVFTVDTTAATRKFLRLKVVGTP